MVHALFHGATIIIIFGLQTIFKDSLRPSSDTNILLTTFSPHHLLNVTAITVA